MSHNFNKSLFCHIATNSHINFQIIHALQWNREKTETKTNKKQERYQYQYQCIIHTSTWYMFESLCDTSESLCDTFQPLCPEQNSSITCSLPLEHCTVFLAKCCPLKFFFKKGCPLAWNTMSGTLLKLWLLENHHDSYKAKGQHCQILLLTLSETIHICCTTQVTVKVHTHFKSREQSFVSRSLYMMYN